MRLQWCHCQFWSYRECGDFYTFGQGKYLNICLIFSWFVCNYEKNCVTGKGHMCVNLRWLQISTPILLFPKLLERVCKTVYSSWKMVLSEKDMKSHSLFVCACEYNRLCVFHVWTNVTSALSPFAQSFSHAKAQQQSNNLPWHDDAPGPPEGGYVTVIKNSSIDMYCMWSIRW